MKREKTILIVDDSELNIQVLSDILKEKSYRIAGYFTWFCCKNKNRTESGPNI